MNDRIKVILPEEVRNYFRTHQNLITMSSEPAASAYFGSAYFEEDKDGNVYTYLKDPFNHYQLVKEFLEVEGFRGDVLIDMLKRYNAFISTQEDRIVRRLKALQREITIQDLR